MPKTNEAKKSTQKLKLIKKNSKKQSGKKSPKDLVLEKAKLDVKLRAAKLEKTRETLDRLHQIGSSRGIESMSRSSYRAQLDMIALAATKANIMISLNGLLVSMLLLSGSYLIAADPIILIPVVLFLITCTTAIVFAVLAARPDVDQRKLSLQDFTNGEADMLIFQQFSKLGPEDFSTAMWDLLKDNERIYGSMINHIYDMGCIANRKFSRLNISYNTFMIGLVSSVLSLIGVIAFSAFSI